MSAFEQRSLFAVPPAVPSGRTRHILVRGRLVRYELRQAAGRRLSIRIDERGVRVGAPPRLSFAVIEDFLRSHGDWILEKIDEYAAYAHRRHLRIADGVRLPVLGGEATVRVFEGPNRVLWRDDELVLAARADADLARLARRGLQRRALEHFSIRLGHFAGIMGRNAPAFRLSSARSRWGSCSTLTGIRLNWRLVHLPPRFGDYVIAHELAHLVEMNHGPRFWAVVATLFPEWREAREELKRRSTEIPVI